MPDPDLPPFEQLAASLDEYLKWIEENKSSYDKMIRNAGAAPEVRVLLDRVRTETAHRILQGLSPAGPPKPLLRTAIRGWLGFLDGSCLDWVNHGDVDRETLHGLLLSTLIASVLAVGEDPPTAS